MKTNGKKCGGSMGSMPKGKGGGRNCDHSSMGGPIPKTLKSGGDDGVSPMGGRPHGSLAGGKKK